MRRLYILAALLAPASAAAGDYTEIAPVRPLTMSDPSGLTVLGLDLQLTKWTEHPPPPGVDTDVTSVTVDIHADIRVAPHWVLIGRLPFSHASVDPSDPDCCSTALGNFTVGARGLWASIFDNGMRAVAGFEASVSLPTASDGAERGPSASAAGLAQLPHDLGLYAPNTTTLRITPLAQLYGKRFLLHAEAGMQVFIYDGDVGGDNSSDIAIRLGLAAGIRATYKIAILAEINSLIVLTDDAFFGDDTVTSLDLGIRYGSGRGIFGIRAYIPLDSALRDLDMLGIGLDAGLRF